MQARLSLEIRDATLSREVSRIRACPPLPVKGLRAKKGSVFRTKRAGVRYGARMTILTPGGDYRPPTEKEVREHRADQLALGAAELAKQMIVQIAALRTVKPPEENWKDPTGALLVDEAAKCLDDAERIYEFFVHSETKIKAWAVNLEKQLPKPKPAR